MELHKIDYRTPKEFRYIGYVVAIGLLIYAIVVKFLPSVAFTEKHHIVGALFILSLLFIIGSKSKIEDERVLQFRYYTHSILSGLLLGFIMVHEIDQEYSSLLPEVSTVLTLYIIQYEYLYRFGSDWIVDNRGKYYFIGILAGTMFLLAYKFLWIE